MGNRDEAKDINGNIFINSVPSIVLQALDIHRGAFLAGGAIRDIYSRVEPKDFDFFFTDTEAAKEFNWWLMNNSESVNIKGLVVTAEIGGYVFQSIGSRNYENPKDILSDFDFKNSCGYMNHLEVFTGTLEEPEKSKTVVVNVIKKPIKEIKRLASYRRKGYDCTDAYKYIVSLMDTGDPNVIMMTDFYDDIRLIENKAPQG